MPTKPRILVAECKGFSSKAAEILHEVGEVEFADLGRAGLLEAVSHADILWVRLRNQIDEEVLARNPNLKVIVTNTTGLNHIDLEATEKRGIRVLSRVASASLRGP